MERRVVGALILTVGTIGATGGVALAQDASLPGTGATGDISFVVAQYSTKTGPFWEKVVSDWAMNSGL